MLGGVLVLGPLNLTRASEEVSALSTTPCHAGSGVANEIHNGSSHGRPAVGEDTVRCPRLDSRRDARGPRIGEFESLAEIESSGFPMETATSEIVLGDRQYNAGREVARDENLCLDSGPQPEPGHSRPNDVWRCPGTASAPLG